MADRAMLKFQTYRCGCTASPDAPSYCPEHEPHAGLYAAEIATLRAQVAAGDALRLAVSTGPRELIDKCIDDYDTAKKRAP